MSLDVEVYYTLLKLFHFILYITVNCILLMIIVYRWLSFKDNGFGYFDFAVVLKADKNSRKHTSNLFEPRNTKCDSLLGPQYVCSIFVFQKKQLTVEAKPPCWEVFFFDSVVLWSSLASCHVSGWGPWGPPRPPGPPATKSREALVQITPTMVYGDVD